MKLVDIENIIINDSYDTKENVINNMVNQLKVEKNIKDKIYMEILEREKIENTVIGFGFAVPHTKSEYVNTATVIYSKLPKLIEWDEEEEGVNNVVLIVIPKKEASLHIDILKDLSLKVIDEQFRKKLNEANTVEEIENILNK